VRPWLEWLEGRWLPSSFTVTDNSDDPADGNSLRYALNHLTAGGNTIEFNIAGSTTIAVGSVTGTPLPAISEPVSILGYTQGGAGYSGPPQIVLNGTSAGKSADGLHFGAGSDGSEVQGLVIQQFSLQRRCPGWGPAATSLQGSHRHDASGSAKLGNSRDGVVIGGGATANTLGGTTFW